MRTKEKVAMPWMAVLAFQDACVGLFDALVFTIVDDATQMKDLPLLPMVQDVISCTIDSIMALGDEVYDVLKALHPLAVGRLLLVLETRYQNQLFQTVVSELPSCPLVTLCHSVEETVEACERFLCASTVSKCFTYPVADVDQSVDNVVSKSGVYNPDTKAGTKALGPFRKLFCRSFVRKHKCWPPVRVTGHVSSVILGAIDRGCWDEVPSMPWPSTDFLNIEIQQCLDFDWQIDVLSALDDKAISGPLSSWPREYDTRYHRLRYGQGINRGPLSEKRLMLEFLRRDHVNVAEEILKYVKREDPESHVCVMCLKERELSRQKGRFFTKNTLGARLYQVTLEKNMGSILEYVPVTSMKFTGDTLQKYLLTKSWDLSIAKLSIDYSKWCQYQRGGLVNPIADQVDKIFGVSPLYLSAHLEPLYTWFIFQDAAHPPQQSPNGEPIPGPRAYPGLATFGEGMLQRLWTLVSSCGVLAHIEPTGLSVEMIGSGDNQIIMCKTDDNTSPQHIQTTLFAALKSFEQEACLKVKLFETFISSTYMEYGKACYVNGKKVTFGLKRATRIGTESQENIPSLNTKISGICSTGVASAADSLTPAASYVTTCVEVLYTLLDRLPPGTELPFERMVVLLLLNRQAGGLKMSLYPSFCMRGVDDSLPICISIWRTMEERGTFQSIIRSMRAMPCAIGKMDWAQMVKDPYSVPISRPKDADYGINTLVTGALQAETKNLYVKNLLNGTYRDHQDDAIVNSLSTMHPMCLKLAASVYEKCNVAITEKLVTTFQTSSSILRLIDNHVPFESVVATAKENDNAMLASLLSFHPNSNKGPVYKGLLHMRLITDCPTSASTMIREELVGKPLVNPSQPCVQHQTRIVPWNEITPEMVPHTIRVEVMPGFEHCATTRDPLPSYIGSDTRQKKSVSPVVLVNPDPMDRTALAVAEIASWLDLGSNFQDLLTVLIQEKTITPVDVVKESASRIVGGSFEHRGQVQMLSRGVHINFNASIMSYLAINSDPALEYAKKGSDYTIIFQALKVRVASWLIHRHSAGIDVEGTWGAVLECKGCTAPVYEEQYELRSKATYLGVRMGVETCLKFKPSGNPMTVVGSQEDRSAVLLRICNPFLGVGIGNPIFFRLFPYFL